MNKAVECLHGNDKLKNHDHEATTDPRRVEAAEPPGDTRGNHRQQHGHRFDKSNLTSRPSAIQTDYN